MLTMQKPRPVARTHWFMSRWASFHRRFCAPIGPAPLQYFCVLGMDIEADNDPKFGLVLV